MCLNNAACGHCQKALAGSSDLWTHGIRACDSCADHPVVTTAMPRASFVVYQPFLFSVDGKKGESFLVILEEYGVNGRRRGKRGRVLRIDDTAVAATRAANGGGAQ